FRKSSWKSEKSLPVSDVIVAMVRKAKTKFEQTMTPAMLDKMGAGRIGGEDEGIDPLQESSDGSPPPCKKCKLTEYDHQGTVKHYLDTLRA
ncbi:hypothetical protein PFISCL1PPCAC_25566, partial [Pristionchus fissidentatus]